MDLCKETQYTKGSPLFTAPHILTDGIENVALHDSGYTISSTILQASYLESKSTFAELQHLLNEKVCCIYIPSHILAPQISV